MSTRLFSTYQRDGAIIAIALSPIGSLGAANFRQEAEAIVAKLRDSEHNKLILDLHRAGYFGSHAIELIILLWRYISAAGGSLVLCDVSPEAREVLQAVGLASLWPMCDTIVDALAIMQEDTATVASRATNS